jgi:hypothetical protein
MSKRITVLYTCYGCGLQAASVRVPVRIKNQDLEDWMQMVVKVVGVNHRLLSPHCMAEKCDPAIPVQSKAKGQTK